MTNPYLNRTAIRDDVSFVGRAAELKRLFNRIGGPQPQSVSIVGDRRIGKSSLLRAVLTRRSRFLSKPESYVFVYLDMQSRLRWTSEMFFERLAAEMASAGVNISSITDYDSLEEWCRSLQQEGRALVMLIDEFQVLMREDGGAEQLPVEFFNYLRSLANSYPVSLVVTSHVDLYTLSADRRLSGSPLFNILHKLNLGSFTETETRELIALSQPSGCVLTADEPWIISRGGHHPLYLQIACSAAFDWRTENGAQKPLDREQLDRRFMEEALPHFEGAWKFFTEGEREIMSAAARGHAARTALEPAVEHLEERGHLRNEDGHLVVFSDCFRDFIISQDGAGPGTAAVLVPAAALSVPAAPPAKVFISYAHQDQKEVKELYHRLKGIGLSPWMDDENLVLGDPWARTIDEAIQSADFFLCCISTHSVDRAGVLRQELSRGLNQWYARSGPDNYLWPVMLEDCEMPKSLGALQRVDLWKEDGWVRLREGINTAIGRRQNLARPTVERSGVTGAAVAAQMSRALNWIKRRALVLGLASFFIGVLLLIGGLSGEALSSLIGRVGLQRAKNWNVVLRGLEIATLLLGAALISVELLRQRRRSTGIALCALLWLGCGLLARVNVPAPDAFALAYDRYLVQRSDDWRRRLFTFVDPVSGGLRDGGNVENAQVQAWVTAQAVVGILANTGFDSSRLTSLEQQQIRNAVNFLDTVRSPAPDDGWAYFAGRIPTITEITGWSVLAEVASVRANLWSQTDRATVTSRIARDVNTLLTRQTGAGGWSPIRDVRDDNTRTYSTVMALWALSAAFREGIRTDEAVAGAVKGMDWLLNERHAQLGWVPNPRRRYQTEDFPGLTAQALVVLELLRQQLPDRGTDIRFRDAKSKFAEVSLRSLSIPANARVPDSDVHVALGDSSTTLEGSSFLWYPWSRAALSILARDDSLSDDLRERARHEAAALTLRTEELTNYLDNGLPYQLAEHLLCIRIASDGTAK
ncbi:MAG TPA: TIR domain-containing protein [Gemmatimonadales bacterium]|nr:TIR domain-containing protein [Gemmatimonadales bacterium]